MTSLPWQKFPLADWGIVDLHHVRVNSERHLYVSMKRRGVTITAEAKESTVVFRMLEEQARAQIRSVGGLPIYCPYCTEACSRTISFSDQHQALFCTRCRKTSYLLPLVEVEKKRLEELADVAATVYS